MQSCIHQKIILKIFIYNLIKNNFCNTTCKYCKVIKKKLKLPNSKKNYL